jgi:hypothetical protein
MPGFEIWFVTMHRDRSDLSYFGSVGGKIMTEALPCFAQPARLWKCKSSEARAAKHEREMRTK